MENTTQTKTTMETLAAQLGKGPALCIAISNYHGGQIVTPIVLARQAGRNHCKVVLSWFDGSDRTYFEPIEFTGETRAAEVWLMKQGVHLDAQGIY